MRRNASTRGTKFGVCDLSAQFDVGANEDEDAETLLSPVLAAPAPAPTFLPDSAFDRAGRVHPSALQPTGRGPANSGEEVESEAEGARLESLRSRRNQNLVLALVLTRLVSARRYPVPLENARDGWRWRCLPISDSDGVACASGAAIKRIITPSASTEARRG